MKDWFFDEAFSAACPRFHDRGWEVVSLPDDFHQSLVKGYHEAFFKRRSAVPEGPDKRAVVNTLGLPTLSLNDDPAFDGVRDNPWLLAEMERFAGCPLVPSRRYGPRVATRGAVLVPHRDKPQTHLLGASITVACDTDEPWLMVLENPDGRRDEVDLLPGQALLFEAVRMRHARPTPMKGKFYAGIFVHYLPADPGRLSPEFHELARRFEGAV